MNKKIIFSCLLTSMLAVQSPVSLYGFGEDDEVGVGLEKSGSSERRSARSVPTGSGTSHGCGTPVRTKSLQERAGDWLGKTHSYSNKTAVIGVTAIVVSMLLAHKEVRSRIGDFFEKCNVIWKNKMPMRSQIETLLDYATSLRDFKNPKHAWKHKGENKLRYAVGVLATAAAVSAATKYYTGNTYCPWRAWRNRSK